MGEIFKYADTLVGILRLYFIIFGIRYKIFASVANPFTEVSAMHVITCFVKFDTF